MITPVPRSLLLLLLALPAPSVSTAAAPTPAEVRARAEALLTAATQGALKGDAGEARGIDEALALYRSIGDRHGEAMALVVRALAATAREDFAAATPDFEAAVASFDAAGDRVSAALFLWMAGTAEHLDDRNEAARARLERAAGLLASVVDDPRGASFAGFFSMAGLFAPSMAPLLGAVLTERGMMEAATPLLAMLFAGAVSDELGSVLVDLGRLAEGEEQLRQAQAASRLLGGFFDSSVYAHLGALRRRQWRLEEAREHFERAFNGAARLSVLPCFTDHRLDIQAMGRLAEIELLLGRHEQALSWNARALDLARQDRQPARESVVLRERGRLLLGQDRFPEAEAALLESLHSAQQAASPHREASARSALGSLAFSRGAYEVAASHLEAARSIYRRLGEPVLEAATDALLIEVYLTLQAGASAASVGDEARDATQADGSPLSAVVVELVALCEQLMLPEGTPGKPPLAELARRFAALRERFAALPGVEPGDLVSLEPLFVVLPAFAVVAAPEGRLEAEVLAPVAQAATTGLPETRLIASFTLAVAALRQGDLAAARSRAESAREAAQLMGNDEFEAYALSMLAVVAMREQKPDEMLALLRRATDALERPASALRTAGTITAFFSGSRHILYDLVIDQLVNGGRTEEAFVVAERARARGFLSLVGNTRVAAVRGGDPSLVARAEALRQAIAEWEQLAGWERSAAGATAARAARDEDIAHAKADYEALVTRIKVSNPAYAVTIGVAPLDVPAVQRALTPRQTLVSYFTTGSAVHAWVLTRSRFTYVPLAASAEDSGDLGCLTAELARFPTAPTRGVQPLLDCAPDVQRAVRLYERLVAPLLPALQGEELLIVPHGPLHHLPFAALRDSGGHDLLERYVISYVPSASVLPLIAAKASSFEGRALVLGAPATAPGLPPLPGAEREARQVAALWGTEPLLGADAQEGRLYGLAGNVDLIHLAAHGLYDPRSSSFSRIALAADAGHDGNLEVHELLAEVDLGGVDLVVLSACDTALGQRNAGDDVVSLARAVLEAGSPAVVSTLWRVDDDSAVELMTSFYGHLRRGVSASAALQRAQLEVRQRFPDPYYWAAFTLTGELSPPPPAPTVAGRSRQ
jgi:tetratricopeptide (TPR) repeat protein